MSQSNVPFERGSSNTILLHNEYSQQYQAQSNQIPELHFSGHPHFPARSGQMLNNIELSPHNRHPATAYATDHSTADRTDVTSTRFSPHVSAYPFPHADWPHPYPLQDKQNHHNRHSTSVCQRPLPMRAHTNSSSLSSIQSQAGYVRRRSLSHGDVELLVATPPNPTFVRLQAPRSRTCTPEDGRQVGSRSRHGRSASQGLGPRNRPMKTNTPYVVHGSPFAGEILPTPIGTPIGTPLDEVYADSWTDAGQHMSYIEKYVVAGTSGSPMCHNYDADPLLHRMTDAGALEQSRHIIQIGAMAAHNHMNVDPSLEKLNSMSSHERALHQLDEVERYLKQDEVDFEEALEGCVMIKDALNQRLKAVDTHDKVELDQNDNDDAPSKMMSGREDHLGVREDDVDLMSMLSRENDGYDYDFKLGEDGQ